MHCREAANHSPFSSALLSISCLAKMCNAQPPRAVPPACSQISLPADRDSSPSGCRRTDRAALGGADTSQPSGGLSAIQLPHYRTAPTVPTGTLPSRKQPQIVECFLIRWFPISCGTMMSEGKRNNGKIHTVHLDGCVHESSTYTVLVTSIHSALPRKASRSV